MDNRHHILLYNPISGHGHLDGWHAMFAAVLLELGHTVVCLTPDEQTLVSRLRLRGMDQHPRLSVPPWPKASGNSLSDAWLRVCSRLRGLCNVYVNRLEESRVTMDMPFKRRCKKRLAQLLVPPAYAAFDTLRRGYSRVVKRNPEAPSGGPLSPRDWGCRIGGMLKALPPSRYFLFNMYMDMYRTDQTAWLEFARACPLPWAGLRFVPPPEPVEAYYSLPTLMGMCFLDETIRQTYSNTLTDKIFACLPDVTDRELPENTPSLVAAIKQRAAGRSVVFMGGSIGGQKNVSQWLAVINNSNPENFFFVQVGEIHWATLPEPDALALRELAGSPPKNFLIHEGYLPDERDFNACIAACDILFAVYKNFAISSNMPGKAAAFQKPILVSDRHLMGAQVKKYGIGLGVNEDDSQAMVRGLEHLARNRLPEENFAAYARDHDEARMRNVLQEFISACLRQQ